MRPNSRSTLLALAHGLARDLARLDGKRLPLLPRRPDQAELGAVLLHECNVALGRDRRVQLLVLAEEPRKEAHQHQRVVPVRRRIRAAVGAGAEDHPAVELAVHLQGHQQPGIPLAEFLTDRSLNCGVLHRIQGRSIDHGGVLLQPADKLVTHPGSPTRLCRRRTACRCAGKPRSSTKRIRERAPA